MAKRGGRRVGTPGKAYPQRTDMNAVRTLPAVAPTGLPYGEHKQLVDAQRAVPLPAAPPATAGPAVASPVPTTPGSLPPFDRPTERPDEPVTAGLAVGPGPGPEVLNLGMRPGGQTMADLLEQVASASGSTDLARLAQRARSLGQ